MGGLVVRIVPRRMGMLGILLAGWRKPGDYSPVFVLKKAVF